MPRDARAELIDLAEQAAQKAHCPYSHFPVGAAVLFEDGQVIDGANVDHASYGLTMCAERVALFSGMVLDAGQPVAIAVACPGAHDDSGPGMRMPCGACRQVMAELMHLDSMVYVVGVGDFMLRELLPEPFHLGV